jgi:hypothetical protein
MWIALGFTLAQAQDNGVPDTLYLEIYPGDDVNIYPVEVRFNMRVTNDIPDPYIDSIAGICIPFCFTSSNPAANALIPADKNNTNVYPFPDLENSIFRHMPSMAYPQERNWMMDYSEQMTGVDWDTRILDLGGGVHFWMSLVPTGTADQRFPGGSRVLVTTMTFWLEDTTTLCIDSCFWPPTGRCMVFSRSDAVTYMPRFFLPTCESTLFPGGLPIFTQGPADQVHSSNGIGLASAPFSAETEPPGGLIAVVSADFEGSGLENVDVVYTTPPPSGQVEGYVIYDIVDHCQPGGTITLTAVGEYGNGGYCDFDVSLGNDPPDVNLPDTWRALFGYTMTLNVPASDVDGDAVDVATLDGFWYEPDSLQSPINPPSFDGGNPALLTWVPDQSETGNWICSFTAADACGAEDTHQLAIQVGTPFCGDCTDDGDINLGDVVCLIGYLYKQGPPPDPLCKGDANGDGSRDVGDVVLLINYLFKSSFAPCFCCCP